MIQSSPAAMCYQNRPISIAITRNFANTPETESKILKHCSHRVNDNKSNNNKDNKSNNNKCLLKKDILQIKIVGGTKSSQHWNYT